MNDFILEKSTLDTKLSQTLNPEYRNVMFPSFRVELHKLHRIMMSYQLLNTDVGIPFSLDHHDTVLEHFPEDNLLEGYTPEDKPLILFTKVDRFCFLSGKDSNVRSQELLSSVKVIVSTLPDESVVKCGET